MLLALIMIILLFGVGGGYYGSRAGYGAYGWSPLALILLVIVVWFFIVGGYPGI